MITNAIKTPCIGVCSTGIGDQVCRGCKRFTHEVIQWNGLSQPQKRAVQDRLNSLLALAVMPKVRVLDETLLDTQMQAQGIAFESYHNAHAKVLLLLQAGASQIDDMSEYGCRIMPEYTSVSLESIRRSIDDDFYDLSTAHFQRYFKLAE